MPASCSCGPVEPRRAGLAVALLEHWPHVERQVGPEKPTFTRWEHSEPKRGHKRAPGRSGRGCGGLAGPGDPGVVCLTRPRPLRSAAPPGSPRALPPVVACGRRSSAGLPPAFVVHERYAGRVTFLEAAEAVLRTSRKPLTAREITEIAIRKGLVQTHGKTPEATMSAALYGAPSGSPIRREFTPRRQRAAHGSVRWTYVESDGGRKRTG
jgi:hypothetical protein